MSGSLTTFADSQALAWQTHLAAASKARAAGACWQCCAEVGCRATDEARLGMKHVPRKARKLDPECAKRIARGPLK